jgi:hypothetical protein
MIDIPPKPQLVLARLDTDAAPLEWFIQFEGQWKPARGGAYVDAHRLRPPSLGYSVDAGDWRAIRAIHAEQAALQAEQE